MEIGGKTAITGIGELKPVKYPEGLDTLSLLAHAAILAIQDAGLVKADIDGLIVTPPTEDSFFLWPSQVAEYLQMTPAFLDVVELGGASACGAVFRAAVMIQTGLCQHCLCLSGGIWDNHIFNTTEGQQSSLSRAQIAYELPYGRMGFNSAYAMAAKRHMFEYGTTPEQLAKIAVDQRRNAMLNPDALFQEAITIQDVLASPKVVDPLHLLEIVRPCSGAAAVIVSRKDMAMDMPHPPVCLLGMGEAYTHNAIAYSRQLTQTPIHFAAAKAFQMAGLKPEDVDFVSLYDCYTITVLMMLEDAGFCPKGEGGNFVQSTDLSYRGGLPCNTHGGQLSCGQASYAGGMSHVTEAVRQIRGEAGARQLVRNQLAFVTGNGGALSTGCSLILGRNENV